MKTSKISTVLMSTILVGLLVGSMISQVSPVFATSTEIQTLEKKVSELEKKLAAISKVISISESGVKIRSEGGLDIEATTSIGMKATTSLTISSASTKVTSLGVLDLYGSIVILAKGTKPIASIGSIALGQGAGIGLPINSKIMTGSPAVLVP